MNQFDPTYFFFKHPIYSPILITPENSTQLRLILTMGRGHGNNITFDGFNPKRKQDSSFTGWSPPSESFLTRGGIEELKIKCKRYEDIMTFLIHYDITSNTISKVGQYPSIADFHINEVKQYTKLLPTEKLKEFTRAIGLAANGVGIGSFVYLRRIFEYLILDAFKQASTNGLKIEQEFQRGRMEEKIELLKDYLPSFLVENKSLYSILSLGIHELDEETCLANFDVLRAGIEFILDENLEIVKKKEKMEALKKNIANIKGSIKK